MKPLELLQQYRAEWLQISRQFAVEKRARIRFGRQRSGQ